MRNCAALGLLVVVIAMVPGWLPGVAGLEQPVRNVERAWQAPPRMFWRLEVPVAMDDYRGLRAEIDARFALHFRNQEVVEAEALEVQVRTPYDPLPEILRLEGDVVRRSTLALQQLKTALIDPFRVEVAVHYRTDASLAENVVLYRVEYDLNGPDPTAFHPARIVITASPIDVAGWEERVEKFRRHEEDVRRLREGQSPE
jgi:hypothetical protein